MSSLWFIVPAHGRVDLARICLRQLRKTCDALKEHGIEASAVVVACDENLDTADELGFWGYEQVNSYLGRKFNDGYQLAAREGVDYVVPLGSDDWISSELILGAPLPEKKIRCARRLVMVAEDGDSFMRLSVEYEGGIGMRIMPMELLQPLGYRPAHEDWKRAIDTITLRRIKKAHGLRDLCEYFDTDSDFQIVDFKTHGGNLNTWEMCRKYGGEAEQGPWIELGQLYPAESVIEMSAFYSSP